MTQMKHPCIKSLGRVVLALILMWSLFPTLTISAQAPAHQPDSTGLIVRTGDMAPDFTVKLTDGTSLKLSDLKGKVVMLQFTASWCGVCRKEMPHIESQIWQRHKDNPEFALVGIDRDEPLATVKKFATQTGITYPMALDPGADVFALYAEREAGITRNILINREGRIVKTTRLYNETEFASLVEAIDKELGQTRENE